MTGQAPVDQSPHGVLWLPTQLLEFMTREADTHVPDETGGVLLGYWATGEGTPRIGADVVVTAVLGPGPRAEHCPLSFTPDHEYHEVEIARLYEESGRRWHYLGDWHTHPAGRPQLSDRDTATIGRIASECNARAPLPLMLVLAGGLPWEPYVWVGSLDATRPRRWWRSGVSTTAFAIRLFRAAERQIDDVE